MEGRESAPLTLENLMSTKKAPAKKEPAAPTTIWYESREKEPVMFPVAGIQSIRNFNNGRLEYEVDSRDVERFETNHFFVNARIVRKA